MTDNDEKVADNRLAASAFVLDGLPNVFWYGFWRGEHENGYACPGFECFTVLVILNRLQEEDMIGGFYYDSPSGVFVIDNDDVDFVFPARRYVVLKEDGGLYRLGAGRWQWHNLEEIIARMNRNATAAPTP